MPAALAVSYTIKLQYHSWKDVCTQLQCNVMTLFYDVAIENCIMTCPIFMSLNMRKHLWFLQLSFWKDRQGKCVLVLLPSVSLPPCLLASLHDYQVIVPGVAFSTSSPNCGPRPRQPRRHWRMWQRAVSTGSTTTWTINSDLSPRIGSSHVRSGKLSTGRNMNYVVKHVRNLSTIYDMDRYLAHW